MGLAFTVRDLKTSQIARPLFLIGCFLLGLSWQISAHYPPWATFQQDLCTGLGGALIACAILLSTPQASWPKLALYAMVLATVPILQRAFGIIWFSSTALLASLYLLGFGLAMASGASVTRRADWQTFVDALMSVLAISACASAVFAVMQWLGAGVPNLWIADLRAGARPYANFAQPNHLATAVSLGIGAFVYFYEGRRIGRLATSVGVALLGLGLVLSQSRTAWLFVGIVIASGLLLQRRARLRTTPLALLGVGAIFVAAILLLAPINDALLVTARTSLESRLQLGPREILWPLMFAASLRHPWVGYGWGQAGLGQWAVALDFPASHYFYNSAHNQLLDLALWSGWPLALLTFGLLSAWFLCRMKNCQSGMAWSVLLGIAAVWAHAMVEFPLTYAYFLVPTGMLMGIAEGFEREATLTTGRRAPMALLLVVASGLLIWIAMEYLDVEASTRVQRFVAARVGLHKVDSAPRPNVRLLDAELALFDFGTTQAREGMSDQELDSMRKVVQLNAFPGAMFRYATALGLNARPAEASAVLGTICRMHMPADCNEAVTAWRNLQLNHPALTHIPPPDEPR